MASFTSSTHIERRADEVFAYATDPTRFCEWQHSATQGHVEGEVRDGATCVDVRRVPGGQRSSTAVISEYCPPSRWAVRGTGNGPIRANIGVTVEATGPADSRVTVELEFVGVGLGRFLAPVVTWRAQQEMPGDMARLKRLLEHGADHGVRDGDGGDGVATEASGSS
jgi:carbon monoxide dehydrogenase subunit G